MTVSLDCAAKLMRAPSSMGKNTLRTMQLVLCFIADCNVLILAGKQKKKKTSGAGQLLSSWVIRAYEEFMLAAQATLRQPPAEAKAQGDSLDTRMGQLGKPERYMWLSVRQSNEMRLRLATMREELAQALTSK